MSLLAFGLIHKLKVTQRAEVHLIQWPVIQTSTVYSLFTSQTVLQYQSPSGKQSSHYKINVLETSTENQLSLVRYEEVMSATQPTYNMISVALPAHNQPSPIQGAPNPKSCKFAFGKLHGTNQ